MAKTRSFFGSELHGRFSELTLLPINPEHPLSLLKSISTAATATNLPESLPMNLGERIPVPTSSSEIGTLERAAMAGRFGMPIGKSTVGISQTTTINRGRKQPSILQN